MVLIYRKLYRLAGLIFPLIYYLNNKTTILIILVVAVILVGIIEILRFCFVSFNKKIFISARLILKDQEKHTISGTAYFLVASLLTILIFDREIAIAALVFTVLGDAAAVLIGSLWGRVKIKNKSLEGSIACFIVCFLAGITLVYTKLKLNITLISAGALAATVMELLPIDINDNFSMPLFTGFIMAMVKYFS